MADQAYHELTAPEPEWDPSLDRFAVMEDSMMNDDGEIVLPSDRIKLFAIEICLCGEHSEVGLDDVPFGDIIAKVKTAKRPGEWNEKQLAEC